MDEEGEEEDEAEEGVLEMIYESIDRFEHSDPRPKRLCVHFIVWGCARGWSCTFAHGEHELHLDALPEADRNPWHS